MADLADIAQEQAEAMAALTTKPSQFDRPSRTDCIECGEDIPEKRQKLGGVIRCFECQNTLERKK